MKQLVSISRRYGSNPDYVIAGGGNTSWKTASDLYIKASGAALGSIDESGFVRMDRTKLAAIWTTVYPSEQESRESAVLADLMRARRAGEEAKRPSVETLLHDLLPFAFVVHTHPALVNGLTCSMDGEAAARKLFGENMVWIPSANPGYILSRKVKDAWDAHARRTNVKASLILLQNHGVFVAADTINGIDAVYGSLTDAMGTRISRRAVFLPLKADPAREASVAQATGELAVLAGTGTGPAKVHYATDTEIAGLCASLKDFSVLSRPFTPDHIVYAGSDFLFAESSGSALEQAWNDFVARHGRVPKLAAIQGLGVFGLGSNEKSAGLAVDLFRDAIKIAAFSESFGGPRYMDQDQVDFINNWEVERYRTRISTGTVQ